MKRKATEGRGAPYPAPEAAEGLTPEQRREIDALWQEAGRVLTPAEQARERSLRERLGTADEPDRSEREELAAIGRKAGPGRDWVLTRLHWMRYAHTDHWRDTRRLDAWRLSLACWWVQGELLGAVLPERGWAIPHAADALSGPRRAWDFATAAIQADALWAKPNGTVRVRQQYATSGGWALREETVPDHDVRPGEFLALLRRKGIALVPELEALLAQPETLLAVPETPLAAPEAPLATPQALDAGPELPSRIRMDEGAHRIAAAVHRILSDAAVRRLCVDRQDQPVIAKVDRYLVTNALDYFPDGGGNLPIENPRSREKHIRRAIDAWETQAALDRPPKRPVTLP